MRSRGSRTTSYSSAIISTLIPISSTRIPIITTLFGLVPLRTYKEVARRAECAELCWALRRAVLKAFGYGLSPRVALSRARSRPWCLSCLPALKPVPRAMRHDACDMQRALCAMQQAPWPGQAVRQAQRLRIVGRPTTEEHMPCCYARPYERIVPSRRSNRRRSNRRRTVNVRA